MKTVLLQTKLFALLLTCGMVVSVAAENPQRVANRTLPTAKAHPLAPALKIANQSQDVVRGIEGYTAVFYKKELVGRKMVSETMHLKLREKPFSVYVKNVTPDPGREAIYVDGRNKNMILAHGTGIAAFVGTVSLKPSSNRAMADNRYPITMIGMSNMLGNVIKQWEVESKYGEIDVQYYRDVKVGDVVCDVIESSHPQPRKQFKFQKTRLYLDQQTRLPIRVQQYGFPTRKGGQAPLVEQYTYVNINTSARLTDADFDTRNPQYGY